MKLRNVVVMNVAVLALTACEQKQEEPVTYKYEPPEPLAQMDTPPITETDPYATDPLVTPQETHTAADPVAKPPAEHKTPPSEDTAVADETGGVRTHVVEKGDTFYKLARHYYGDQSKWREIWKANQTRVPDPNTLKVGTKLIIP